MAKKDVTWRSRSKKDPGIPSNFPYKAKILEEIEAKKMKDLEERELAEQQRLEARKAAKEQGVDAMDEDMIEDDENGLAALVESAQQAAAEYEGTPSNDADVRDDELDVI